jgi:hypothetical protein
MEPDRFDDVAFRIVESTDEQPPDDVPRRRRRWLAAIAASALAAGALAAGASALTGSGEDAARSTAPKPRPQVSHTAGGVPFVRDGRMCRRGHAKRQSASRSLKY